MDGSGRGNMTEAQKQWMAEHPDFGPVGPPRAVTFEEWGTLYADGTYERMDNSPRGTAIRVGNGAVGVAKIAKAGDA
jgi:hypothetical protein